MAAKLTSKLILCLIITVAVCLSALIFPDVQFVSAADEGYYLKYAAFISAKGLAGFSELFKDYLQHQQNWFYPSPLRAGFIILSAVWLKIFGNAFINLAYLSLFLYALSLCVAYYFSRKYLGEQLALLFVILLAFSPLQLAMSRRALSEAAVNLFSVWAIWLGWDFLRQKSLKTLSLLIVVLAGGILIKESSALLLPAFLILFLIANFIYKEKIEAKEFVSILFFPLLIAGLIFLFLGCLPYLADTLKIILRSPATNVYALQFGSGPWYRYLIDYIILSPWVVILAIGFIFYIFLGKEKDRLAEYCAFFSLLSFALFNIFTKNVRYVIILDMPMRLLAFLMLERIARKVFPQQAIKLLLVLVIALALSDYLNFYDLFVRAGIYDPSCFLLLKAKQIIP